MTPEQLKRLAEVFDQVDAAPQAERAAMIERLCGGDAALADHVRRLLGSADESTVGVLAGAIPASEDTALAPGLRVGRYELVRRVGAGGFGIVWDAIQHEPVRRRVAVKILKAGVDTEAVLARFRAERQALANLDHPNVARVFDAGETERGRPYFVMEFIDGEPIDTFCDRLALPVTARLRLMLQVCDAVRHAHQRGIIHRDLKPANILVAGDAAAPTARVIDFGIAKAVSQDSPIGSLVTLAGASMGTPAYMSPEQAAGDAARVDTRTDVYGLGAVLFKLLTGTPPIDRRTLESSSMAQLIQAVIEHEPTRASLRVTKDADALPRCGLPGTDLAKRLRGDLDRVLLMALDRDPDRRYPGVAELAADLTAHLEHRPVAAVAPSAWYVVRKLARRHRVPVAAAALLTLAVVGGTAGTAVGFVRARDSERRAIANAAAEVAQRRLAEQRFDQVHTLSRSLLFDIFTKIRDIPGTLDAQLAITDLTRRYLDQLADGAGDNLPLLIALQENYAFIGRLWSGVSAQSAGDPARAIEFFDAAIEILTPFADPVTGPALIAASPSPPDDRPRPDMASVLWSIGHAHQGRGGALRQSGRLAEAGAEVRRGHDLIAQAADLIDPEDPRRVDCLAELAGARGNLARVQLAEGDIDGAAASFRSVADIFRARAEATGAKSGDWSRLAITLLALADIERDHRRDNEAALVLLGRASEANDAAVRLAPDNAPSRDLGRHLIWSSAVILMNLERFDEADAAFRNAEAIARDLVARDIGNLQARRGLTTCIYGRALLALAQDRPADAVTPLREYLAELDAMIAIAPSNKSIKRDRFIGLERLGESLAKLGQHRDAVESLDLARVVCDDMAAADPAQHQLAIDRIRVRQLLGSALLGPPADAGQAPEPSMDSILRARDVLNEAVAIAADLEKQGRLSGLPSGVQPAIEDGLQRIAALLGDG